MSTPAASPIAEGRCEEYESIVASLSALSNRYAAELSAAATEHELSPQMALALLRLGREGQRMSEFARSMACDAGNLSGTIDRLEDARLVVREQCASDRRVRIVRATPEGRRVTGKLQRRLDATRIASALGSLGERERRSLRATLEHLCDASDPAGAQS